jgi:hypothetical protein
MCMVFEAHLEKLYLVNIVANKFQKKCMVFINNTASGLGSAQMLNSE